MPLDPEMFFRAAIQHMPYLTIYETFLLNYGRTVEYDSISPPSLEPGICFGLALSASTPLNNYCEGFAAKTNIRTPLFHSWCVTPYGDIEDLAWGEQGLDFFGLQFKYEALLPFRSIIRNIGVIGMVSTMVVDQQFAFMEAAVLKPQT